MLLLLLPIFYYKDIGGGGGIARLDALPSNSTDVIFFGSSHAHCTVDEGILWDNYGIPGFTFSAGSQAMDNTRSFLEYALDKQNPKVVAVELNGVFNDGIYTEYTDIFRNLLGRQFSLDYNKRAVEMAEGLGGGFDNSFELITKYPLLHYRYKELKKSDFQDNLPFLMGYRGSNEVCYFERPSVEEWNAVTPIPADIQEELDKIVKICEENNTQLLLWAAPFIIDQERQELLNYVAEYAEENSVAFLNFNNMYDEIHIDFGTDFRDTDHLNNAGAIKVTEYLGNYLSNNYFLEDHRGDVYYKLWDQNTQYLNDRAIRFALQETMTFNEYLNRILLLDTHYSIGLVLKGDYAAISELYGDGVMKMGISETDYYTGGYFTLINGDNLTHYFDIYSENIRTKNGEIHVDNESDKIVIDGIPYELPENSIGIYIYDNDIGFLVDVAMIDVYNVGDFVEHFEIVDEYN